MWFWWVEYNADQPQGTSLARCILPAFLCAHIFIKRETSGYEVASLWSLGDRTQVRISEEIELVPLFTSSKQRRKRKFFTVVFVQVVKKSALDVQNLLFFLLLIGLIAVAVTVAFVVAPRIYRLV